MEDYDGNEETRRSTTELMICMGEMPNELVPLNSNTAYQLSTAEAEYSSLSECCKHCTWYINKYIYIKGIKL